MDSKNLNTQQLKAINHGKGPLLIIAGAGTGKTTVVTERISRLIVEKNLSLSSVLALTFTDKAAYEMQERIDILLPYGYTNLWIHTFHSFCDRILRDDAHIIGIDPGYKLISEPESVLLLRRSIFDLGLKYFMPDEYMVWAKNLPAGRQDKNNKDEDRRVETEQYQELANAYKKYEDLKVKESAMDFSDLISNTLLMLRKRPQILKKYQTQFKFILVDEFQDTNYAQNELAILLAGDDKNITVVADDDQSIYRFRGAAVSNVLQFKKNFPETKIITLIDNYRSTQTILDSSYALIQHN